MVACKELLKKEGINNTSDFRKWALKNHPDKGGSVKKFQEVSGCKDEIKVKPSSPVKPGKTAVKTPAKNSPKARKQPKEKKPRAPLPAKKQAACLRKTINHSSLKTKELFYHKDSKFNLTDIEITSPKLFELIKNIKELDAKDKKQHGKLFKHFIFTDLKIIQGLKMIASALQESGMNLVIHKANNSRKVIVDKGAIASGRSSGKTNFAFLSSSAIKGLSYSTLSIRKDLLSDTGIFNNRKNNVHGENIRIIILDSGFKEGIDLFDVKYCHVFDSFNTESDKKQAVGRALRYCGQSSLPFNGGWKLQVFMYKTLHGDKDMGEMYWDIINPRRKETSAAQKRIDDVMQKASINNAL